MLIDTAIMSDVFQTSLWNFSKLLFMNVLFFYWIAKHVFPQFMVHSRLDSIMFNLLYMLGFVMLSVPILIFFHIFSLPLFLLLLVVLKALFLHYFENRSLLNETIHYLRGLLIKVLDFMDNFSQNWNKPSKYRPNTHIDNIQDKLSARYLQRVLTWFIFAYILYIISLGGFISYADAVPDTAQFVEWVNTLHSNILFKDNKTAGADFFGQATIVFFFQKISNIDSIVLFNIYPIFLVWFVLFGLYYVVYKITFSSYSALFSVILFGIVFLSPWADTFLGYIYTTAVPNMEHLFNLNFYLLWEDEVSSELFKEFVSNKHIPFERYSAGLAYELASSMFLINNYFIAKSFFTKKKGFILLYGITLFLVFVFHGGGAIYLVVSNSFILIIALLFRHLDWKTFKQGLFIIVLASILGNLWMLSVIKYGIPQDFGAAAPFLDNLFKTKQSVSNVADGGEVVSFVVVNVVQISIVASMFFLVVMTFFIKRKFLFISMIVSIIAVMLIYFAANLGLPRAAKQFRAAEYLLLVFAMGGGFYFYFFIVKPLRYFYTKKSIYIGLFVSILFIVITISQAPRWIETDRFMTQTNSLEYNNLAYELYKISQKNQPFSWLSVSYVQTYPKVLGKGFHINTPDFLLKYDPREKYLEIPMVEKIYIFVENRPNSYMGTQQWYYRWRPQIQAQLKEWISIYQMLHDNISVYYQNEIVSIYEIDNDEYIKYETKRLKELKNRKKHAMD
jgi:hypothetical protein